MSLALRPAVDAEKRARDVLTYAEWGGGLTPQQYLEREQILRAHPWAKSQMVTWFLVEDERVLASCETFRNDSTVSAAAGSTFAVASVFTESGLRGRGHAAALMSRLVDRLREEPAAQASVLFSDVGAPIYKKSGYQPVPTCDQVLPAQPGEPDVEWLDAPAAPPRVPGSGGQLVLHPSAAQLDWHFERSRLYARFLSRASLRHQGARTSGASAWWTANYKGDELLVLCLDAPDAAAAQPILAAAQAQAHEAGLARVRLWETISLDTLPDAQRVPRHGALPMVAALGANVTDWCRVERALWV